MARYLEASVAQRSNRSSPCGVIAAGQIGAVADRKIEHHPPGLFTRRSATWPDLTRAWYAGLMTAKQFRLALSNLGLTQQAAAQLFGLCLRTVNGYAGGKPIPVPVAILINLMVGGVVMPDEVDAVR
jgi:hypothetical protein